MNSKNATYLAALCVFALFVAEPCRAQEVDASKPTNFYPLLDNSLEYNSRDAGGNLIGYRGNLTYPPSEEHLFLVELPVLYNDETEGFGLGDIRARYFYLPYKNYDRFFGAFGPSIDIFAPTGSFKDRIGSSSWVITPGVMGGFMLADWIQAFVVASYQYVSKPTTDLIPEDQKQERHGVTVQAITPVVFNDKFFMQITPIWSLADVEDTETSRYIQEVLAQYALAPTLQLSAFYRGNFKDKDHTVRVGLVVFFVGSS